MKPSVRALVLSLAMAAVTVPALAHSPRVFVPQPRQVNPDVEYRVVILASNLGDVRRRFEVRRIIPQPLNQPPLRELIHGSFVSRGETRTFTFSDLDESLGVFEITGAPQVVLRARLEIWENGTRLGTTALPAVTARQEEDEEEISAGKHGGVVSDLHLQGLSRTADGSVTTDLTIVNFDDHDEAECGMSILDARGEGIAALPFLHVPAGAGAPIPDVLSAAETAEAGGDILDAWGAFACEEPTFTAWAAVYRDGGREVEYVLPSAELKP